MEREKAQKALQALPLEDQTWAEKGYRFGHITLEVLSDHRKIREEREEFETAEHEARHATLAENNGATGITMSLRPEGNALGTTRFSLGHSLSPVEHLRRFMAIGAASIVGEGGDMYNIPRGCGGDIGQIRFAARLIEVITRGKESAESTVADAMSSAKQTLSMVGSHYIEQQAWRLYRQKVV